MAKKSNSKKPSSSKTIQTTHTEREEKYSDYMLPFVIGCIVGGGLVWVLYRYPAAAAV